MWRIPTIFREAVANVIHSPARTISMVLLATIVTLPLSLADLNAAQEAEEFRSAFEVGGGHVLVAQNAAIDAAACVVLGRRPEVERSGGFRKMDPITFTGQPGLGYQRIEATRGLLDVWANKTVDLSSGYVVAGAAALELGVAAGSFLSTEGGTLATVASVIDVDTRAPFASRWIIDVQPPIGVVDECWIELSGEPPTGMVDVIALALRRGDAPPEVVPLIAIDEFSRDPVAEFGSLPQRNAGWPIAAVLAIFLALLDRYRRSDIAVYRVSGTSRMSLFLMGQVEVSLVLVAAWLAQALWVLGLFSILSDRLPTSVEFVGSQQVVAIGLALTLVAAPVVRALVASGNTVELLRSD